MTATTTTRDAPLPVRPAVGSDDTHLQRAKTLASWLDARFVDPILGLLVPGAGDIATAGVGLYVVGIAVRRRLPVVVIARMLLNLAVDMVVGAIPLVGDLFDFLHRANQKNLRLLEARHGVRRSTASDWGVVAGAALVFVAAMAVPIVLVILAFRAVF